MKGRLVSMSRNSDKDMYKIRFPQRDLGRRVSAKVASLVAILQQKRFKEGDAARPMVAGL
jgi:hypothetical protein